MKRARSLAGQVVVVTGAAVRGISRRAPHVYAQRWLPPLQLVRGVLPAAIARFAARSMPEVESRWLATGGRTFPVGACGAADARTRA
jgi:hypothetical protein